jgi:hypothetical protein
MNPVYRICVQGTEHGDILTLGICIEQRKTNPTF